MKRTVRDILRGSVTVLAAACLAPLSALAGSAPVDLMTGVPPERDTQVTFKNYREYPYNRWAFSNMGAPANVLMVPRGDAVEPLVDAPDPRIGELEVGLPDGRRQTVEQILAENFTDGYLVLKGNRVLYERYFGYLDRDAQHIWFSATKSLTTTALGLLVAEGKVDLQASPAAYIPELKGSAFERVSIRQVLDHVTAIDFKENYTDPDSDFLRYYAPALNMGYVPGARDAQPESTEIYGVHDFLRRFIRPDPALKPGEAFDYNSANADVAGWLVARISGMPLQRFIRERIWAKLGAEHDAYMLVDRAYQAVATGGMNSTLRDAARFGRMILNRGRAGGEQVIPERWVDASLEVSDGDRARMRANPKYGDQPWEAYKNMWWVLDSARGEYAAVGIFGQVIYIDRRSQLVIAYFGSQQIASAAVSPAFKAKLAATRAIARMPSSSIAAAHAPRS